MSIDWRKKTGKRRYRRLAAALVGATFVSSAALQGIPVERVYAYSRGADIGKSSEATGNTLPTPMHNIVQLGLNPEKIEVVRLLLFNTDIYEGWQWRETAFPRDMALGILASDPRISGSIVDLSANSLSLINGVDFTRNVILFAHLGATTGQGYGIGISKVVQTGNNLTVAVRFKSPGLEGTPAIVKTDDFVRIPRGTLDFRRRIDILFEDKSGTMLARQVLMPE
ncbi:MAG: PrcB C-terminal domain containing protein [Firmicutes bacterium]|nr:PrcB C-terminal domain containing protein [Bacillota bacterium]